MVITPSTGFATVEKLATSGESLYRIPEMRLVPHCEMLIINIHSTLHQIPALISCYTMDQWEGTEPLYLHFEYGLKKLFLLSDPLKWSLNWNKELKLLQNISINLINIKVVVRLFWFWIPMIKYLYLENKKETTNYCSAGSFNYTPITVCF